MKKGLAVILALGCSAAGDGPMDVVPPLILEPRGVEAALLERVAERWIAASGLDILIGTGGAPITREPLGPERCGEIGISVSLPAKVRWIHLAAGMDPRCGGEETALMHEVGHALCEGGLSYPLQGMCHSETGMMAAKIQSSCIDEVSLSMVCSHKDCKVFNPEC